jgi:hypothetical protein
MRGLACPGNCNGCAGRPAAGVRGLGAFYDSFPAPFNDPIVLAVIAVVAFLIFGGGFKLFSGRKSSGSGRRAKLRLIQAQADEQRAKLLAS